MDDEYRIAFAIWLGVQLCQRPCGSFTHAELRDEMEDLDLCGDGIYEYWELEVDRRGPFTRKPGTLNDMVLVEGADLSRYPRPESL